MFATIKAGSRQWRVQANDVIKLDSISGEIGETVTFEDIICIENGADIKSGEKELASATVSAEILEQKKDNKIIVFKKKRRQHYRRKNGHRQPITVLRVTSINESGSTKAPKAKTEDKKAPASTKDEAKKTTAKKATTKKTATKAE